MEIYRDQLEAGRHFLHEHPMTAKGWAVLEMVAFAQDPRVMSVVGHMCCQGMTAKDGDGIERPVMKPTRWMSSSLCVLMRLEPRCPRNHEHVQLVNGRAAGAAIYPPTLCGNILRGI